MTRNSDHKPNQRRALGKAATLICAGLIATFATEAIAQNAQLNRNKLWEDIGASERIDLSGRLHMLSQRIAASTCSLEAGVAPSISTGILMGSADEIDRIMNALKNGNPLMKVIGAETDPRVLASIERVNDQWGPVRDVIDEMQQTGYEGEDLSMFETWNIPYFQDANLLVSEISAQYSNPSDLLQRDAILVDLAGRQRMRTQMMLKQACEIWSDGAATDDLAATIDLFGRTHEALLNGESSVGIDEAPTPDIRTALEALGQDWSDIQNMLSAIAGGAEVEGSAQTQLYLGLNEMLIKADGIVAKYTKYAKHTY